MKKRKTHYETNKLQKRENYEKNKKDVLKKSKTHYKTNKKDILHKIRVYHEANKQHMLAKRKQYYQKNRVKILQLKNFEKKFYEKGMVGLQNYREDTKCYLLFTTEPTLHMFRHSLGYCAEEPAHPTRHAMDKQTLNEKCLNCGNKLIFRSRRWGSSFPGLHTLDHPLGPPST